ncbi:PucR family transcriptional regulator [Amycolatopsis sp. lyj-90]|uniref:PucR family transcriptional regulator n=1 Tax=Amycolatopsis sp. lyj-90 TaxID=2789285 RepID=UPI00397E600E
MESPVTGRNFAGHRRAPAAPRQYPADKTRSSRFFWAELLQPDTPTAFDLVMSGTREVEEFIADAGLAAAAWAAETAHAVVAGLAASYESDNLLSSAETRLVEGAVMWTLYRLVRDERLPESFRRELRLCVRERLAGGLSADDWLRPLHDGYAVLSERLLHSVAAGLPPDRHAEAMQRISSTLYRTMGVLADEINVAFVAEQRRQSGGTSAERIKLVRGILEGARVNAERAGRHLGYELTLHHLCLMLWYDPDAVPWCDDDTLNWTRELETTATNLLHAAGCSSTLLVPGGSGRLWAWGGRVNGLPTELGELSPERLPTGHVHVAAGIPAPGISGFCRSYEQAASLERLSRTVLAGSGNIHDYRTLELFVLMSMDVRQVAEFVRRQLGGLVGTARSVVALRETLKCYLDHERSVTATAARMRIAKNTVSYRVKKAEQSRGCPIEQDSLHLHLALHLTERMAPGLLAESGAETKPRR